MLKNIDNKINEINLMIKSSEISPANIGEYKLLESIAKSNMIIISLLKDISDKLEKNK